MTADGYSEKYGARELRRVLQKRVTFPIASAMESGQIEFGDVVTVDFHQGEYLFWREPGSAKAAIEAALADKVEKLAEQEKARRTPPPADDTPLPFFGY